VFEPNHPSLFGDKLSIFQGKNHYLVLKVFIKNLKPAGATLIFEILKKLGNLKKDIRIKK